MKNGFVNKNKFLEDFGRFFFVVFLLFRFYLLFEFYIRYGSFCRCGVRVRKRMVMIVFCKKKGGCWNTMHALLIHLILFIEMFVYSMSYRYVCAVHGDDKVE